MRVWAAEGGRWRHAVSREGPEAEPGHQPASTYLVVSWARKSSKICDFVRPAFSNQVDKDRFPFLSVIAIFKHGKHKRGQQAGRPAIPGKLAEGLHPAGQKVRGWVEPEPPEGRPGCVFLQGKLQEAAEEETWLGAAAGLAGPGVHPAGGSQDCIVEAKGQHRPWRGRHELDDGGVGTGVHPGP